MSPIRPTCLMSPVWAMPITSVEKINGAMIDLIRLRNSCDSGRTAIPQLGASQPSRMPRPRPMKIWTVTEGALRRMGSEFLRYRGLRAASARDNSGRDIIRSGSLVSDLNSFSLPSRGQATFMSPRSLNMVWQRSRHQSNVSLRGIGHTGNTTPRATAMNITQITLSLSPTEPGDCRGSWNRPSLGPGESVYGIREKVEIRRCCRPYILS